jgi:hypothetical protein
MKEVYHFHLLTGKVFYDSASELICCYQYMTHPFKSRLIKVKSSLRLIKYRVMKAYGGVEV